MSVLNKGRTVVKYFEKSVSYLASIAIAVSTLMICVEVFTRYIFHFSSATSAEISKYLVICSAFLVAGPLTWSNEHIAFDFLKFKGWLSRIVTLLIILVGIAVSIFVLIYSIGLTSMLKDWGQTTESGEIQMWWITSFMVVGMALVACYYVALLVKWVISVAGKGKGEA